MCICLPDQQVVLWRFRKGSTTLNTTALRERFAQGNEQSGGMMSFMLDFIFHPLDDNTIFIVTQLLSLGRLAVLEYCGAKHTRLHECPIPTYDLGCGTQSARPELKVNPISPYGLYSICEQGVSCDHEFKECPGPNGSKIRPRLLACFNALDATFSTQVYVRPARSPPWRTKSSFWNGQMTAWIASHFTEDLDEPNVGVLMAPLIVSNEILHNVPAQNPKHPPMYSMADKTIGTLIIKHRKPRDLDLCLKQMEVNLSECWEREDGNEFPKIRAALLNPAAEYLLDMENDIVPRRRARILSLWSDDDFIVFKHNDSLVVWSFYTELVSKRVDQPAKFDNNGS